MRLLEAATKRILEFPNDQWRPPYVILSHTWGSEEVTLQELNKFHENGASDSVSLKAGFKKIEACCDQALRDGFEWAWIDTCCIDKTSSAELSEAINSMFKWYEESRICYAFLSDVGSVAYAGDIYDRGSSFRASRWFERGWTLQELLAPGHITFFNGVWQQLGELSRCSELSHLISEITNIPPVFLNGLDLRNANAAMKMSWVSGRTTTREEDIAYCLLGIFNVHMPLLYGEGMRAFDRLQEEIMKQSYDHSLLAWGNFLKDTTLLPAAAPRCGILATSPAAFADYNSLYACPRSVSNDHQITNQGLRIQLALRAPRNSHEIENGIWLAVLDCYSSKDPSKRVAIPLQKVTNQHGVRKTASGITQGLRVQEGETFVRMSRYLVFSDIAPTDQPYGCGYFAKTIQIVLEKDLKMMSQSWSGFDDVSIVEFPSEYRYELLYVHQHIKVQDFRTGDVCSLRVKERTSVHIKPALVSRSSMIPQLIDESTPLLQSSSIAACVRFKRQSQLSRPGGSESFLATFAETQVPGWGDDSRDSRMRWRLLPCPWYLSQEVSELSDLRDLRGLRDLEEKNSLKLAREALVVRDFTVPAGPDNLRHITLSKIEVKETITSQRKPWNMSMLWDFARACDWFLFHNGYTIGGLVAYAAIVAGLSTRPTEKNLLSLYVAIWTLCFMPLIYQIRREGGDGSPHVGVYEGIIRRVFLVFMGVCLIISCRPYF